MDDESNGAAIVSRIEEKVLQLSGKLRDLDNHPFPLSGSDSAALDAALEQLLCRVTATRALIRRWLPQGIEGRAVEQIPQFS